MKKQQKFQVGDVVKLKSGGPDMTVKSCHAGDDYEIYDCQWFAGKKLEAGRFPADSLEPVKGD
jgi:uncharacterized protein YodC (DUF2158 family)